MLSNKLLVITILILRNITAQEDEFESVYTELHLAEYDLIDAYDEISNTSKNVMLGIQTFSDKVKVELQRGTMMRQQYESNLELESKISFDLKRNWTLLTRSGDFLLDEHDYKSLITFHNANEEVSWGNNIDCSDNPPSCALSQQEYEGMMANIRNPFKLLNTWEARQDLFSNYSHQYNKILALVNKAYGPNGQYSAIAYWEMLVEYEDGYSKAKAIWNDVLPLYKKLHAFVKTRLYKYYNIFSNSDLLPVYLLGTNFGDDWSNIADIILTYPYLYTEVNEELKHLTVHNIWEGAAKTAHSMGFEIFKQIDLLNSSSCRPHIFSDCASKHTQIFTCSKLDWGQYLNVYETVFDVALRSVDYEAYPRMQNRFSPIDEAVRGMSSLLAVSDLYRNELILENVFSHEIDDKYHRKNTALLLMALRILPKLSYYLVADTWRLEELKLNNSDFIEKWWKLRNGVQGVQGLTGLEPDFLADSYISSNRPLLSKFMGTILQFQILDYYQKYSSNNKTIAEAIGEDVTFRKFIKDRPNKTWLELLNLYYGLQDITAHALLEYFKPLEEYLDNAPKEQVFIPVISNPKHIRQSKDQPNLSQTINGTEVKRNNSIIKETDEVSITNATNSIFDMISVLSVIVVLICISILVVLIVQMLKKEEKKRILNYKWYEPY